MNKEQIEEMTLQFLREHDEMFLRKDKNSKMSHPYLSKRQFKARCSTEIPLSNLSNKQKMRVPKFGDCLDYEGAY